VTFFATSRDAYDAFMGRYANRLAPRLITFAGVQPGEHVLDVGCGPGSLTEALAELVGSDHVAAIDPSEPFAVATAERVPGSDVQVGGAESLPWPDDSFDAALAQLVVNFMSDADAGVAEMRRVVRPGGVVAACTWDYAGGMTMLRTFWDAALSLDPETPDEARTMRYNDPEVLRELWLRVGLEAMENDGLVVEASYLNFDDFWEPFTGGVGPAGAYTSSLEPDRREALREECRRRLGDPDGAFTLSATAWAVKGRA
jgi:SAM-dependent methyltransferase